MKMRLKVIIFLGVVLYSVMGAATDLNIHCGNRWIGAGVTEAEVLQYCGKPDSVYEWQEVVNQSNKSSTEGKALNEKGGKDAVRQFEHKNEVTYILNYSRWSYNQSSRQFVKYLLFQNGILVEIAAGDYGN